MEAVAVAFQPMAVGSHDFTEQRRRTANMTGRSSIRNCRRPPSAPPSHLPNPPPPPDQAPPTSPTHGGVLERVGGGLGTQTFVYQKWPDQSFPTVNFVFSHDGHFGLGHGGKPPSSNGVQPF